MSINRNNSKVKDVFFGSLPPETQSLIMNIHKVVKEIVNREIKRDLYNELRSSTWAMSTIDHFAEKPKDKYPVGSCRVFKIGNNKYKAVVQITNTFPNKEYGWIEELMHGYLQNTFIEVRKKVRKEFDLTINNNGEMGSDLEGFSLILDNNESKKIWEYLSDVKEKNYIKEFSELPILENTLINIQDKVNSTIVKVLNKNEDKFSKSFIESLEGAITNELRFESIEDTNGITKLNFIPITEDVSFMGTSKEIRYSKELFAEMADKINEELNDDTKNVVCLVTEDAPQIVVTLDNTYAYMLEKKLSSDKKEVKKDNLVHTIKGDNIITSIAKEIIDKHKVDQSQLNLVANIINKNYFNKWSKYYNKLNIRLVNSEKKTVSFKIPPINSKLVEDLLNGKITIFMYLHRLPNIDIKISSATLLSMKDPNQLFSFLQSSVKYYSNSVGKYGVSVLSPILKFPKPVKQLISGGKLDGVVRIPLTMLFTFDDIDLNDKNNFKLKKSDIAVIRKFSHGVLGAYNSNKKDQDKVIKDIKKIVYELKKNIHTDDKNLLNNIAESVQDFYDGKFNDDLKDYQIKWEAENVIDTTLRGEKARYLAEAFGVKKLKKIPMSVVAYCQIEGEDIKDANSKYMIAAYTLGKIELIEWYIELINTRSKKYLVPHTKQYLENMRQQLLKVYNKIMATPIPKADRPIIDIDYSRLESANNDYMTENWVISGKNWEFNLNEWAPGNPLWIVAGSGYGKSTLTEKLAKENNAEIVSSDIALVRLAHSKEEFEEFIKPGGVEAKAHKVVLDPDSPAMEYIRTHPDIPYGLADGDDPLPPALAKEMNKFYYWLIKELKDNPKYNKKKYIIEGCNIAMMKPDLMATKPMIILGTSRMVALYRRAKRSAEKKGKPIIERLFSYIQKYNGGAKVLDDALDKFKGGLRKSVKKKYNNVFYVQV